MVDLWESLHFIGFFVRVPNVSCNNKLQFSHLTPPDVVVGLN